MTETFKLVHLSDVHLGPIVGFHPRHMNAKRALGLVNWHRGRRRVHLRPVADLIAADALAQNPDHIAVTGDLANLGLPGEFAAALTWLESLGDPQHVSVVPGNHDIYSGRIGTASCLSAWASFMRGSDGVDDDQPVHFPYVRKLGPVALIGLNSAVPTPPFVAAGRLGKSQIAELGPILDRLAGEQLIRVVLIHHPPLPDQAPPRRALQDAVELTEVLERYGAELVLHGHNHRDMLAWRTSAGRGIPVVGVASASAAVRHKDEPSARYNLIRLRREDGIVHVDCETRGLDGTGVITSLGRRDLIAPE
ncbi:metallophosphoesterase [Hyphomicrobium sp.]|uniref:metallophosphoesterase family protein n=1 Tax=Hyphomicrobium sp. TaxID=82 RepID=UPI002E37A7A8|nr:metallophosphoesterase [Hyphomicrobium sp.]HEX2842445.1 metallophosphoesterase [Hyphomicrobium sp.]